MINDGALITANNWPSAWQLRGKKVALRRTLNSAPEMLRRAMKCLC